MMNLDHFNNVTTSGYLTVRKMGEGTRWTVHDTEVSAFYADKPFELSYEDISCEYDFGRAVIVFTDNCIAVISVNETVTAIEFKSRGEGLSTGFKNMLLQSDWRIAMKHTRERDVLYEVSGHYCSELK